MYLWISTVEAGHNLRVSTFELLTHFSHGLLIQDCGIIWRVFREQVAWQVLLKPFVFPDKEQDCSNVQPQFGYNTYNNKYITSNMSQCVTPWSDFWCLHLNKAKLLSNTTVTSHGGDFMLPAYINSFSKENETSSHAGKKHTSTCT